jgi:hypothetical protein
MEVNMLILPAEIMVLMSAFAPLLDPRVFECAKVLVIGAILAPRKRMVSSTLRVMGLIDDAQYQNYYRVLNRARWSSLQVSKVLLLLLVATFVPTGTPVILVIDETLERRYGRKIKALSIFRDPVRSSQSHVVKTPALRWVNMAIVVKVPWDSRPWALPFLTVLAPSEKTNQKHGKRHKTSPKWARQMICQVRRWLPDHDITVVTDGGLVAIETGHRCMRFRQPVTYIARLRMDARLYDAAQPKPQGQPGPQPCIGKRQLSPKQHIENPDTLWDQHEVDWYGGERRVIETTTGASLWYDSTQKPLPIRWIIVRDPKDRMRPAAFFGTDPDAFPAHPYQPLVPLSPFQVLEGCIMRHNHEVTFEEVREHLGFETQRQWNDLAIARTSPAILGLFSFVVLLAYHLLGAEMLPVRQAAWYTKPEASFSDVIAFVRRFLWQHVRFSPYVQEVPTLKVPATALQDLIDCLAYAA